MSFNTLEYEIDSDFSEISYRKHIEKVQSTYDKLAPYFDDFYPPLVLEESEFLQALHTYLQKRNVRRLLDCACGTGREIIPLAQTGDYDLVVGADLSPGMVNVARKKGGDANIQWFSSDWIDLPTKMPYRDFDAIICLGNPFAHLPHQAYVPAIKAISSLLRKECIFLVNRRNWEAELGLESYRRTPPVTTIQAGGLALQDSAPRISLLNVVSNEQEERMAYFTYHLYTRESRTQLLHLVHVNPQGYGSHEVFEFTCFPVYREILLSALHKAGLTNIQLVEEFEDVYVDAYAEEQFFVAIRA